MCLNMLKILSGPSCDLPPEAPTEGTKLYIPKIFSAEYEQRCAADGDTLEIICPSFMSVFIKNSSYGRSIESSKKEMCNGKKDSTLVVEDCQAENEVYSHLIGLCHGKSSCLIEISNNMTQFTAECLQNQTNELNILHSCGKAIYIL